MIVMINKTSQELEMYEIVSSIDQRLPPVNFSYTTTQNLELSEPFNTVNRNRRTKKISKTNMARDKNYKLKDVYYARFLQPNIGTLLLEKPEALQKTLEVVIGSDDRKPVNDTTKYPSNCICKLYITAQDGSQWVGTGTYIGPNCVLTASHCVYIAQRGGWVKEIEVVPALNKEPNRPYGSDLSSVFYCPTGYINNGNQKYDFAAIITNHPYGEEIGSVEFTNLTDEELKNLLVTVDGYPGEIPQNEYQGELQYFHSLGIKEVNNEIIFYDVDTTGGESGSLVMYMNNEKIYGCGIHNIGSIAGNSATRINDRVFDIINNWSNLTP